MALLPVATGGFLTRPRHGSTCFSTGQQEAVTQRPGLALDVTPLFSLEHRGRWRPGGTIYNPRLRTRLTRGRPPPSCGHSQPCSLSHFHQRPWLKTILLPLVHSDNHANAWVTALAHDHPKSCTDMGSKLIQSVWY